MKRELPFQGLLPLVALIFGGLQITACSAARNPALIQARTSVQDAQRDPQITANAPVALHEAERTLRRAEHVWEDERDEEEVQHLAYVVEQKVEIARERAQQKAASKQLESLGERRTDVLLSAREREIGEREREIAEREREIARLKEELQAKETERGLVLTLGDVLFEVDKAELKPGAQQNLYQLTTFLRENPEREVLIEGHTDSSGSDSYNIELSQRRAEAVQRFLVQNGMAPERVIARGYGEAYPIAPNETAAGRQQNRRVEIVVLKEGEDAEDQIRGRVTTYPEPPLSVR